MNKIVFYILPFCLVSNSIFCQVLKGKVIDNATKQPIEGASISIITHNIITKSSSNGLFKIPRLTVSRYSVKISSIGYEDAFLNEILVSTGKETEITAQLREIYRQLEEITVKARNVHSQ